MKSIYAENRYLRTMLKEAEAKIYRLQWDHNSSGPTPEDLRTRQSLIREAVVFYDQARQRYLRCEKNFRISDEVKFYCARRGICRSTFYYWIKTYRPG